MKPLKCHPHCKALGYFEDWVESKIFEQDISQKTAEKFFGLKMYSFEIVPNFNISLRSADGLALLTKLISGNPVVSERSQTVLIETLNLLLSELESSVNASSPITDATNSDLITELLEDVSLLIGIEDDAAVDLTC